jgi:uncharacterized cupredoxin-like copper-binding protein
MKKLITTTLLSIVFITPEVIAGIKEHDAHGMQHLNEMMNKHHTSIGQPGKYSEITKTLSINASDQMNFSLSSIELKAGQTIEVVVTIPGNFPMNLFLAHVNRSRCIAKR